jgi:RNA polymerase sigma-70 factor (ECF subfamily)
MRRAPNGRGLPDAERRRLCEEFLSALQQDDLARLIAVVGPHPRVVVDTGEQPVAEPSHLAEPLIAWSVLFRALRIGSVSALSWEAHSVNGAPGLVGRRSGRVVAVVAVSGVVGAVTDVWIVENPEKLRHWQ